MSGEEGEGGRESGAEVVLKICLLILTARSSWKSLCWRSRASSALVVEIVEEELLDRLAQFERHRRLGVRRRVAVGAAAGREAAVGEEREACDRRRRRAAAARRHRPIVELADAVGDAALTDAGRRSRAPWE